MDVESSLTGNEHHSVVELLDRVLNTGVVIGGDVMITVADIELIYLRLQLSLCSVETAREAGWMRKTTRASTSTQTG